MTLGSLRRMTNRIANRVVVPATDILMPFPLSASLFLIGLFASIATLAGCIYAALKKSRLRTLFVVGFTVSILVMCFGGYQRYERQNVLKWYLGFNLSSESQILRYHANIFSRDSEYSFEIRLSPSDAARITTRIGRQLQTNDAAIERLPKDWNLHRTKEFQSSTNSFHSTWFNFDYDASRNLGWLVITNT